MEISDEIASFVSVPRRYNSARTNDVAFAQKCRTDIPPRTRSPTALSEIRVLELLFLALVRSAIFGIKPGQYSLLLNCIHTEASHKTYIQFS